MKTDIIRHKHKVADSFPIRRCQNKDCQSDHWMGLSLQVTRRENGFVLCDTCFYEVNPRELRMN